MKTVIVYLAGVMKSGWQDIVKEACSDLVDNGIVEFLDSHNKEAAKESDIIFVCAQEEDPDIWMLSDEIWLVKWLGDTGIVVNLLKKDGEKNRYFQLLIQFCDARETDNMKEAISILRDEINNSIIRKFGRNIKQ